MPPPEKTTANNSLPLNFSHLPREEKILVACSGGADSLALLIALRDAEYSVVAAHVNHKTRLEESDGDEEFLRDLCARFQIPLAVATLNLKAHDEASLRVARYDALQEMAREFTCARIATGHNADDVLETILLHLLRDATASGWCGIPPVRELCDGVLLVRPMLGVSRQGVRNYLMARNQGWREDSSNSDPKYLRNRVRHELLPQFVAISGGDQSRLTQQAARSAEVLREEFQLLNELAEQSMDEISLRAEANLQILDGLKFRALPVAIQRRVLRAAAQRITPEARELGFERVEEVRRHIAENRRRAVWQWRRNLRVEWTGEYSGNRIRFWRV